MGRWAISQGVIGLVGNWAGGHFEVKLLPYNLAKDYLNLFCSFRHNLIFCSLKHLINKLERLSGLSNFILKGLGAYSHNFPKYVLSIR